MSFPSRFGKFLLLERVNVGGMAEVFKAKTTGVAGFERILAIKRILPNLVEDDDFIRMFIDEARIAVQLNHANIVQIYELGKQGEHYYIAMEYIPSRDLRGILDRLRASGQLMPIAQAAHITAKVAEGLDYAHRRKDPQGSPMNIIHRDVSPQNILVGFEGEVKVIDFGIAKAANRASKTQAGVLKGKFGYMSPEQVRGLPIDRRSDIFAVGVLLYEMLTGERLFIGESDFSTLERVRNADVVPPTSFNKKISPQLEAIVLKTLAREVEDRYQWASELALDLQAFVADTAGAFNARRLSASMREMYAPEVALEKKKLEEFMRILPEDVKEKPNAQPMSVLPLPQRGGQSMQGQSPLDDDEGGGEFGADKTFVIEASAAGLALGAQATDPNLAKAPARKPLLTASDASDEVSLYGGGGGDSDDDDADARTLVGAENPYYAPPPAAPPSMPSARVDAATRPMMPTSPPPPPAPPPPAPPPQPMTVSSPSKPRVAPAGRPFDAVAAAMAEDGDDDVAAAVSGSMGGGSPFAPPTLSQSQDRPTMSQPSMPPQYSTTSTPPEPWPAQPAPPAHVPQRAPAPRAPPPPAVLPMPWVPLGAALGVSGVVFAAALAFFVVRYQGASAATPAQLQLSAVGVVPADVVVSLDDVEVGRALPLDVALPEGKHLLHVKGTGIDLTRDVVGTGGTVRQAVVFGDVAAASTGAWRLLLAAIDSDGAPVDGAEVFVNGRSLGLTPLEAELDDAAESLALKVKKAGYAEQTIDLKRAGRLVVGPATIALKKGEATNTAVEPVPATDPVKPEPVKPEPVKPEPVKPEPVKPEPTKPEPTPTKPEPVKPEPVKPTPTPTKPEPTRPEPVKPTPTPTPATTAKVADIQLGTSPYADTTIDGRKYGMTPFFGPRTLTLPVGVHRIEFFDKVNNKKYKYQLKLKAPDPNNKVVIQFNKNDPPKVEGQVELKKID